MAEFNLKMIKILFLVVIATVVLAMSSGINIFHNLDLFRWKKIKMELAYLGYKRALAAQENNFENSPAGSGAFAESIPVLMFHGVIENEKWGGDKTNISLAAFTRQMFALKKAGYETISLGEFFDFMKNGRKVPKKSFLLTFDDGRRDSYYPVDPVLKALNYRAAMFVIAGESIDSKPITEGFYLSLSELRQMENSGRWEIESHGDFDHDWEKIGPDGAEGHFLSNRLWLSGENRLESEEEAKKRIIADLKNSKKKIERNLGKKVHGFAYPFNDYGQSSINFPDAKTFIANNIKNIYSLTFAQVDTAGLVSNYPDPNQNIAKRIDVNSTVSTDELLKILDQNEEKRLPYADTFWDNRGWKPSWGYSRVWGNLAIGDDLEKKSGNMTTLLGTQKWRDYSFVARLGIKQGRSISQVVRYQDGGNYAACNFGAARISITQKIGGEERLISEKDGDFNFLFSQENNIETFVKGDEVSCAINGKQEISAKIPGIFEEGGIGFHFWDDLPQASLFEIKKVEVRPAG